MEKYEHKNNDSNSRVNEKNVNSSLNMKDEFFDKMMNQNNINNGVASGLGAA
jgi:hypothetical protein